MSDSDQALTSECLSGNLNKVKELLVQGIDPNSASLNNNKYTEDKSTLCVAASEGHLEDTKLLIANGANVNFRCKHGESALFLALRNGHVKVSECLLKAGAKVAYTAKSEGNVFYENWEAFTQALKNVYPEDINSPIHADKKAVVQLLLEYNNNSPRPSTLYEVLYCSLTVFTNPIAVYCVGVYAELSSGQSTVVFSEDNFLSALCHAFDFSLALDFLNTVHSILLSNKIRQKDAAQSLVRHFQWADLVKKISEQSFQIHKPQEAVDVAMKFFCVFNMVASNFNVRSDIQVQFLSLNSDSLGQIGRLIKCVLDYQEKEDQPANGIYETWQFLFYLLKQNLREGQKVHVARLLLRSGNQREANSLPTKSFGTEFEQNILLRSVEEDIALTHMLLGYGVVITGDCFVNFIQQGHVDLVDRCADDEELLFCKEVNQLFQSSIKSVKNASNRNMRRCIKIIKNQRNAIEKARCEVGTEPLIEDIDTSKVSKKKQKQRVKKQKNGGYGDGLDPKMNGVSHLNPPNSDLFSPQIDLQEENKPVPIHLFSNGVDPILEPIMDSTPSYTKQFSTEDSADGTDDYQESNGDKTTTKPARNKSKKRKKSKKSSGKSKNNTLNSEMSSDEKNEDPCFDDHPEDASTPDTWKELMLASSRRRRRQSSSSSDCSTGPRKSVHFSHPLTFYENRKITAKSRLRKMPSLDAAPKASNLKPTLVTDQNFDLSETYRTYQSDANELINCSDFDSNIPWVPGSKRWAARFEDLSETEVESLKVMSIGGSKSNLKVYFCDKQRHLNIGSGPDFSSIILGLTSQGREVAIKKISKKRLPLLSNNDLTALLQISEHHSVNRYDAVLRDKVHFYILQGVGEYSLDQIIRRKIITLPLSVQEACLHVAEGLDFLHKNDILHMNLKPCNVLLGVDNKLRLCDYGIHRREHSDEKRHPLAPTISCLCWMAKECAPSKGKSIFTKESDIQSLGMLFYYIITGGGHPFGSPDSFPGECVKNISKGTCNLTSLSDPLAHDLVKTSIAREPQRRLNISEILSHPFFWSNEDKEAYFSLLIETSLSGGTVEDGRSFMEILEKFRHGIIMTYSRKDLFVNVTDHCFATVGNLIRFINNCFNDPDLFKQHAKPEVLGEPMSVPRYFQTCFPGFLIQGHKVISWDDVENASLRCEVAMLPNIDCEPQCNSFLANEDPLIKTILNVTKKSNRENAPPQCCPAVCDLLASNEQDELVPKTPNINVPGKEAQIPGQIGHISTSSSTVECENALPLLEETNQSVATNPSKDKKNPNLCLLPDSSIKIEDASADLSPCNNDENILLDYEWVACSKKPPPSCGEENLTFHSSSLGTHQATPPDDWIEVGSPLMDFSSMKTSAPINLHEVAPGSLSDGNNSAGSSSGCSVDGCYDFDSYVQNWPGSPDVLFMKDSNPLLFPACVASSLHSGYTDIDELD